MADEEKEVKAKKDIPEELQVVKEHLNAIASHVKAATKENLAELNKLVEGAKDALEKHLSK
jgi:hypothetical protein